MSPYFYFWRMFLLTSLAFWLGVWPNDAGSGLISRQVPPDEERRAQAPLEGAVQLQPGDRAQRQRPEDVARFARAKSLYFQGVNDDNDALKRAAVLLAELFAKQPQNAKIRAYLGSARLLEANLAWALWRKASLSREGLTLLDAAVAQTPEDIEVRFIRGVSAYHLPGFFDRAEQAAADLRWAAERAQTAVRAGALDPALATAALFYDGVCRETRSDPEGARASWRAAVALAPETPAGKDAARRLTDDGSGK